LLFEIRIGDWSPPTSLRGVARAEPDATLQYPNFPEASGNIYAPLTML
jgi:hypothetical protein